MKKIAKKLFTDGWKNGKIAGMVVKAAKVLWDFIMNKAAADIAKTGSVNKKSSLDDFEHIIKIFTEFKETAHARAAEIEEAVDDEIRHYVEGVKNILLENRNMAAKYGINISRIEKKADRIVLRMKGNIDFEISKRVSLNQADCRHVIEMIPGAQKKRASEAFMGGLIKDALSAYWSMFRENMDALYAETEDEITGAVAHLQKLTEINLQAFKTVDADNFQETAGKAIAQSEFEIGICNLVESIMEEA